MAKSSAWTIITQLGVQGIGLISTIVLARLLLPADFGLVSLATAFSGALQAISEFGFETILIQDQQANRQQYDTAWTLSVCRNTILALILGVGAKAIASAYGDPRIEDIVYWLAFGTFIDGLQNIRIVDFRKELAFHKYMTIRIVRKIGTFVITLSFVFFFRNYWALVAGTFAGVVLGVILSYQMAPYLPRITFAYWRQIFHFSKWLVFNNIVSYVYNRSDTLVIGKLIGAQAVGIYSVAHEIANLTTSNLIAPIRSAIFPGYAKVSNDHDSLRRGFTDVFAQIMLIGVPLPVGIGLVSEPLVRVILGEHWVSAIPLIQILTFYGFLGLISAGTSPIFLAMNRPHYLIWEVGASAILMVPSIILGVHYDGVIGAAWAVTLTGGLATLIDFLLVRHLLKLKTLTLLNSAWRPALAMFAMVLIVRMLRAAWPHPSNVGGWGAMLAAEVSVGALVYIAIELLLWLVSGRPVGAEGHVVAAGQKGLYKLFKRR